MRRNPINNPSLSSKLLGGDQRFIKGQVYAQTYLVACELQNRIIRPSDSQVDSIMSGDNRLLSTEVIREVSLANTQSVSRRVGTTDLSGFLGNRHEEMVTLALDDITNDTQYELVESIRTSLERRGISVDQKGIRVGSEKVTRNLNEHVAVSILNSELNNVVKIHSSNYYTRGSDGILKPHEISDKAVVFEKYPDLMIVPPSQRPFTMGHTSDFGYIGIGSSTSNPNRVIADVQRPFIIRPKGNVTLLSSDLKAVKYIDRVSLFNGLVSYIPKGKYNGLVINLSLFQKFNNENPMTASELKEALSDRGVYFDRVDLINPDESNIMSSSNREAYEHFVSPMLKNLDNSRSLTTRSIRGIIHSNYEAHRHFVKGADHVELKRYDYRHGSPKVIQKDFENAISDFDVKLKQSKYGLMNVDVDLNN